MTKHILATIAAVFMLAACDNFHASDNGDLDGLWQLTSVDTLSTGNSADVREQGIYWAVQAKLLKIRDVRNIAIPVYFRFSLHDNTLTLSEPVADNRPISDSIITDVNTIRYYGLSHLTETLQVLHLSSGSMTLQSELLRMRFRKY